MTQKEHERVETRQRRCPRLGSMIRFSYCRTVGDDGLPCFKVFDCWWEQFDVVAYMRNCLAPSDFDRLSARRPPDKIASLLDLVHQARQRLDNGK